MPKQNCPHADPVPQPPENGHDTSIVSPPIDTCLGRLGGCSARSQVIFSVLERVRRRAKRLFRNRAMVFDQAPGVLPAAECAAHRHHAPAEHDQIACLSAELGFQVAACSRARELYAGLHAHFYTPQVLLKSAPNGWNPESLLKKIGRSAKRIVSPMTLTSACIGTLERCD